MAALTKVDKRRSTFLLEVDAAELLAQYDFMAEDSAYEKPS
jgi:hypothetical protein